jgi:hypothetical protein
MREREKDKASPKSEKMISTTRSSLFCRLGPNSRPTAAGQAIPETVGTASWAEAASAISEAGRAAQQLELAGSPSPKAGTKSYEKS